MPYYKRKRYVPKKPAPKPRKTYTKLTRRVYRKKPPTGFGGGMYRLSTKADPFPARKFCKLVYSANYTLSANASLGIFGTEHVFSLNSIHDPDQTSSTNTQPYGHDELALLYKQYKVNAVKIDLLWSDPSADGQYVACRIIPPQVASSLTGGFPGIESERPMTVMKALNNTGSQKTMMSFFIPMAKAIGITPLQFKASSGAPYSAVFGSSPADQPRLAVATANRGTTSATVYLTARLTYYTQCYERHVLATS